MDLDIGPIVTNTGIIGFLGRFYEGQKISKYVPSDYRGLGSFVLESDKQYINTFYKNLITHINV